METPQVQNSGTKKPLIIFLSIISFLSLTAIGVIGYLYAKEMSAKSKDEFNIENVDPQIANKISGSIIYSSEKSESADYFSPELEISFKYNEKIFSISEGTEAVYIYPVDWDLFSSAYLKIEPTSDIKGLLLSNSLYSNLKVAKEETQGNIGIITFSYDEASLLDNTKILSKTLSVVFKKISDQDTAYIEIRDFNILENNEILSALKTTLDSISTDVSEIDQQIEAKISSGILGIKFDRSQWSVSYKSDYSISLVGAKENEASVNLYISDVYNIQEVKDSNALRAQLNETLASKRKYFDEHNYTFKVVEEPKSVSLGGITFESITVEYNYGYEPSTIESLYVGYLDGKEKQVDISSRYYSDNASDKEKIQTLLSTLTLDNKDIYSQNTDSVLGTSSVTINKATILGQSSTVRILSKECDTAKFSSSLTGFNVAGKSYSVCSAGMGSGFVVDDNGHIVTNAHVADPNDLDVLIDGWSNDGSFEEDIMTDVFALIAAEYGPYALSSLTEEMYYIYQASVLSAMQKEGYLTITKGTNELYVQGDDIFDLSSETLEFLNPEEHYKAELIASNQIASFYEAALSEETGASDVSDLALIQTDEALNYPTIPVSSEGYVAGQQVYVIGYPGVADNSELVNTNVVLSSTVTQGTISAIKPNSKNTFDLLQIDASVQHGNSGGPIIDADGNVIGVATYGTGSESGNYNMGISGEEVQRFLSEQGVTSEMNTERKQLESALADISLSYYSRAEDKLEEILGNQQSLNVIIQPFIDLCTTKIDAGEDKSPLININASLPTLVIFVILILLLCVAVALLVVNLKAASKKAPVITPTPNMTV